MTDSLIAKIIAGICFIAMGAAIGWEYALAFAEAIARMP